jgi:hypothetical protein
MPSEFLQAQSLGEQEENRGNGDDHLVIEFDFCEQACALVWSELLYEA